MKRKSPYRGTLRHARANWPIYASIYGGLILALLAIGLGVESGWYSLVPLSLALMLLLAYFFVAGLWVAHKLYDPAGLQPHYVLFEMGQLEPQDRLVYVDLGARDFAIELSRRLASGKVIVVDVYNPQWNLGANLQRYRANQPHPPHDPRLTWQNGRFDLLPLPDKSVPTVMLHRVLSEFWQEGDRQRLLREVHRILTPNGRLLVAERVRSQQNWLLMGPAALTLADANYWTNLLQEAGFTISANKDLQGIIHCFRADKPTSAQAQQLALNFPLE